jgi:hypothetical protein
MVFMLVMLLDIVSLCLRMHSASKVMITYLGRNSVVWKTYGSPRRDKDQLQRRLVECRFDVIVRSAFFAIRSAFFALRRI